MTLQKDLLFPVPVFHAMLDEHAMINIYLKSRLRSWRNRHRGGREGEVKRHRGNWQSANNMQDQPEFRLLSDQLDLLVGKISNPVAEQSAAQYWCAEMMANISDRFGYEQPMTGRESGWCGVYCVQAPENCGGIVFHRPGNGLNEQPGETCQLRPVYAAVEGRVLIFPSWLPYEFEANEATLPASEGERISVSFLFCPRRI